MKKPVSVALIGCGAVVEIMYATSLQRLGKEGVSEVVGLVDPNPVRMSAVGSYLPAARRFADLDALLAAVKPEMAIIATPHRFHPGLTVRCLEEGCHVLVEKPMAITTAECEEMLAAAERTDRLLAVGHFRRFFPACRTIKDMLDGEVLGPVRSFRFVEGQCYDWPAASASYFKRKEAGGGVLIDAGVHMLDLLLWWLGEVADFEYADDAMGGVEANCRLQVTMASGASGMIHLSRDWAPPYNRLVIECEKGWVAHVSDVVERVEWGLRGSAFGCNAHIHRLARGPGAPVHVLDSKKLELMACFEAQLRNVCAAARGLEDPLVPAVEARGVIDLVQQCYQRRQFLEMPWLSDVERERARELAHG